MTATIVQQFQEAGLDCCVLRIETRSEQWHCGYVRIPEGTALFRVAYNEEVPEVLKAASEAAKQGPLGNRGVMAIFGIALGGLWHAGDLIDVHGSVTFSGELRGMEGFWWGFDVAHARDQEEGRSTDPEFAESQTRSMARQLATLIA